MVMFTKVKPAVTTSSMLLVDMEILVEEDILLESVSPTNAKDNAKEEKLAGSDTLLALRCIF